MKNKRIISFVLTFLLCCTLLPVNAFAGNFGAVGTANKVKMHMDFLGSGEESTHPQPEATSQGLKDLNTDDVFLKEF